MARLARLVLCACALAVASSVALALPGPRPRPLAALSQLRPVPRDYIRRVVLVERNGFIPGKTVDISVVDAPGVQKLLIGFCRDPTLAHCYGFAIDSEIHYVPSASPDTYGVDDVFKAFFIKHNFESELFASKMPNPSAPGETAVLEPEFSVTHTHEGRYELTYGLRGVGKQQTQLVPRRYLGYQHLFIGVEAKVGVSDPVGTVTGL